jgi:hypothetical protein
LIKLRLVGHTADLEQLIYTSKKRGKKGSHVVPVDDLLFDELRDVVRRRNRKKKSTEAAAARAGASGVEPKLSPRAVQRLLRAGRPVQTVAKAANAPVLWVERFLGPVLYERAGAIQDCQKAVLEKPRLGDSGLPLGEAVLENLRTRRVAASDEDIADGWDASRLDSNPWAVSLRFRYRGREQRAVWRYDPATRTVTAGNRLAMDLGWVPPGRKPLPVAAKRSSARPKPKATKPKRGAPARPKRKAPARGRRRPPARGKRRPARRRITAKRTTRARRGSRPSRRR